MSETNTSYNKLAIVRTVFGHPIEIRVSEAEVRALYDTVCRLSRDRHLGSAKTFPKMPNEHAKGAK